MTTDAVIILCITTVLSGLWAIYMGYTYIKLLRIVNDYKELNDRLHKLLAN